MSRPSRNAQIDSIPLRPRTYFVSSKTWKGTTVLQTERMAQLMMDVLRTYTVQKKFTVREFVIMRNQIHVLLTVPAGLTTEKAVQMIKGNFSYRGTLTQLRNIRTVPHAFAKLKRKIAAAEADDH